MVALTRSVLLLLLELYEAARQKHGLTSQLASAAAQRLASYCNRKMSASSLRQMPK